MRQNIITALFNYAADYFTLTENPCHKADKTSKREIVGSFWTKDKFGKYWLQWRITLQHIFHFHYHTTLISVLEKFLALTPKDFDFEKNTLNITHSLQRINKQNVITPPQTPIEGPKPQVTISKVVSPKDKISLQQVHENELNPCVGFARRT